MSAPCSTLHDVFSRLPDTRKARGKFHPQASILVLCLIAILHGCKNPSQIFVFGARRLKLLWRLGFRPPKERSGPKPADAPSCPNEDTISGILGRLAPKDVNECLALWLVQMLPAEVHAAVDGKALRGAEEHVLEVFVSDLRLTLWQMPVSEKKNELSMLEAHLAAILKKYPQLKLLTGDAMFCQKTIARTVHEARRHYFLQLKSPHATDVGLARDAMRQLSSRPPLARTEEKRGAVTAANS